MAFIIDTFSHEYSLKSLHSSHWKQALESNTLTMNNILLIVPLLLIIYIVY